MLIIALDETNLTAKVETEDRTKVCHLNNLNPETLRPWGSVQELEEFCQGLAGKPWYFLPKPTLAEMKQRKLDELADRRWQVETGGVSFGEMTIPTDRETSRLMIKTAYDRAREDPEYQIPNWKAANGVFVTLTNSMIIAIGDAVLNHIQACFDHEAVLTAAILAAEDEEALEAIDINSGWPG